MHVDPEFQFRAERGDKVGDCGRDFNEAESCG